MGAGLRVYGKDSEAYFPLSGIDKKASVSDKVKELKSITTRQRAYVFDENGNLLYGFEGKKSLKNPGVSVSAETMEVKNGILIYSHAGGQTFGGTFSPSAVKHFAESQLKEIRVIGTGNDSSQYILRARKDANREKLAKKMGQVSKLLKKNYEKSYNSQLKKLAAKGLKGKQLTSTARQVALGMYDRHYKKYMDSLGFDYIKLK